MALTLERIQKIENHLMARISGLHPRWINYVRILLRKATKEWAASAPPEVPEEKEYDDLTPGARLALRNALKAAVADTAAQAEVDELVS